MGFSILDLYVMSSMKGFTMKISQAQSFFFCCLLIALCSCSNPPRIGDIKVGMTYDEVEKILGKPQAIDRGSKDLTLDVEQLTLSELSLANPRIDLSIPQDNQRLEVLKAKTLVLDSQIAILQDSSMMHDGKWAAPHRIQSVGNLLYVAWVYPIQQTDSHYVPLRALRKGAVLDTLRIPHYFVDNQETSKSEYESATKIVYRHPDGSVMSKSLWESYQASGLYKMPAPAPPRRRISPELNVRSEPDQIVETVDRKYFIVTRFFSVLFDASSGRVVSSGFAPQEVMALN